MQHGSIDAGRQWRSGVEDGGEQRRLRREGQGAGSAVWQARRGDVVDFGQRRTALASEVSTESTGTKCWCLAPALRHRRAKSGKVRVNGRRRRVSAGGWQGRRSTSIKGAHLQQTRRVVNSAGSGCWRLHPSARHLPGKEAARMSQHASIVSLDAALD